MCGILVAYSKKSTINIENCSKATKKHFSRGPDFIFEKVESNGKLFLSQTILSITGKPKLNRKFRTSVSERFEIYFNGEIYNYPTLQKDILDKLGCPNKSKSDTETLVNLHDHISEKKVFSKLEGMFCYVIFDQKRNELIIARDMIGEKVLYKYEDDDFFILSSQIGPILEIIPEIKIAKNYLREYFFTRHLLTRDQTIYNNLQTFPPGTLATFDLNKMNFKVIGTRLPSSLIDVNKIKANGNRTLLEFSHEMKSLFSDNAKKLCPEIPYFSVFSGGIDSSLASKYAHYYSDNKPKFICLQFEGKDKVASQISKFSSMLNLEITNIEVTAEIFQSYLDECYSSICMPLPTHSFVSQAILAREVRKNDCKVLITGDGGDELFGGYEFYKSLINLLGTTESNPSVYSGVVDLGFKFNDWKPSRLIREVSELWNNTLELYQDLPRKEAIIQSVLFLDYTIQVESVGIRASDTMSMMSSVESRGFYLTEQIMEFGFNLNSKQKIDLESSNDTQITRPLMKHLFSNEFSSKLLLPKQGFSGYPNESVRSLVDNKYPLTKEFLELSNSNPGYKGIQKIAYDWKLMNTEYFLQKFKNFM